MSNVAEAFERAFSSTGVKKEDFPPPPPKKEPAIKKEDVPEKLLQQIRQVMLRYKLEDYPLPFLHITPRAVKKLNGVAVSTGFIDDILANGCKPNLNVSGLVIRTEDTTLLATPEDFLKHPETFVENIYTILERYFHHGTRTNRVQLGALRHVTNIGVPSMVVIAGRHLVNRGGDGDEHYVISHKIPKTDIIGTLDMEGLQPNNKSHAIQATQLLLKQMERVYSSTPLIK